jgi:hypothetical protein
MRELAANMDRVMAAMTNTYASRPGWKRHTALVTGTPSTMDGISACVAPGGPRVEIV